MGDAKDKKDLLSKWLAFSKAEEEEVQETNLFEGPLSFGQERLYFLQQVHPGNPFYHYTEVYEFSGDVHKENMIKAFQQVVERHDILRTTFYDNGGTILQRVNEDLVPVVSVHDMQNASDEEIEARQSDEARIPFDLIEGPLVRLAILDLGRNKFNFVVSMHHIITDKWSMRVVRQDWAHYYAMLSGYKVIPEISPLGQRYIDYSANQKVRSISDSDLEYWRNRLGDIPVESSIDHDKPRPKKLTYTGGFCTLKVPTGLADGTMRFAKDQGVTPYVLFLAVFKLLISKYSQSSTVTIGSPISNRDDENLENVIGFFNETMVLHSDLSNVSTTADLLKTVQTTVLEAFDHAKLPFEILVKELKPERRENINPLFQTMFLYHDVPEQPQFGSGIDMSYQPFDLGVAKFDLTMYVSNEKGDMEVIMEYSKELFNEDRVKQMLHQTLYLLEQMLDPNALIEQMTLLDDFEEKRIINLGLGPAVQRPSTTVIDMIYENGRLRPEHEALSFQDYSISYGELIKRVDACASYLVSRGAQKSQALGVSAQPGFNMVIGILAVMKMGGFYVPVDPEYPSARKSFMLLDAEAKILLTDNETIVHDNPNLSVISFSEISGTSEDSFPELQAEDLAYMIYTSGSSGKPKGVMVTHENLLNSTLARLDYYGNDACRFLLMSSFSFDSSVAGIFWSLISGGSLILLPRRGEQDIHGLVALIEKANVTHTLMLPTLYHVLLDNAETTNLEGLKKVILAGESSSLSLIRQHFNLIPDTELYNEYGPTECTVWATAHQFSPKDKKVLIGRPIANTSLYVLDGKKNLVPIGQRGELFINGDNLSNGYYHRPDLNADRFVDDPFIPGKKMYRTGDMVKYSPAGQLEFIGRKDEQIKLRGYRIELGSIDAALMSLKDVQNCKTIITGKKGKENLVLCFEGNKDLEGKKIKSHLLSILPRFMVPERFHWFENLPKLPNGKIDNVELASQVLLLTSVLPEIETKSPEEKLMLEIWKAVLKDSSLGVNDNFFAVGGDSIISIQIIAKIRERGFQIQTEDIFTFQTVRELSSVMVPVSHKAVDQAEIIGEAPFLPIHNWHFDLHKVAPHHWSQAQQVTVHSALSKEKFQNIVESVITHHDGLRASFDKGSKTIRITKTDTTPIDFVSVDIERIPEVRDDWIASCHDAWRLEEGGLFRILALGDRVNQFVILAHHLVIDAVSWNILLEDINTLWGQVLNLEELRLPKKSESILEWSKAIFAVEDTSANEFWKRQEYNYSEWSFVKTNSGQLLESNVSDFKFNLELGLAQDSTGALPLNLRMEEAVLICMIDALSKMSDNKQFFVDIERNGREHALLQKDVSRTIGWLTSMYTLPINAVNTFSEKSEFYIYLKELYRNVPNSGIDFGKTNLRNTLTSKNLFGNSRIVFNYLGALFNQDKHDFFSEVMFLTEHLRAETTERDYLIEVNVFLKQEKLHFDITYDKRSIVESDMRSFSTLCKSAMEELIKIDNDRSTPSDFPDIELDQDELDHLLDQF